jgi:uncharacterized SAM-binding protein YcdF (DUF218 family)
VSKRSGYLFQHAVRLLGRPLEVHDQRPTQVDAIVVLGAPLRPDGQLNLAGRERVSEGVQLWKQGFAPLLAFTGGAASSAAEAPAMAARAEALGVPREALIVESQSRTTAENARYTAELLHARGVQSVWVVSQPFHVRRGRRLLRQEGLLALTDSRADSVQHQRPDLAWRWIAREYVAWTAHFLLGDD